MDKAKKKIIDWLCKKYLIQNFFIAPYNKNSKIFKAKRQMMSGNNDCQNLIIFSGAWPIFVYSKTYISKRDILEILLKESKENDIFLGSDIKILEKGMTFEQLAIEADLNP